MRASRLVSILLLLQTRDRMTAQELAARLEVSERTIYRDVQSLSAAGVPVFGEPGHDGGYRLVDGYRTRLTGLTTAEAESLFLTGLPIAATELGLGAAVAGARLKLLAALPPELRERAEGLHERFHLDAPAWYHEAEKAPSLPAVAEATWCRRRIRLRYRRWEPPHEATRTVDPHGVVLKAGQWYLVARRDGRFRTYRVSRIQHVHPLDETFEHAAGFDLAAYWRTHLAEFDTRRHSDQARLRLSPAGMHLLPFLLEPAVARAARATAVPDRDGWVRVTVPIESHDSAVRELLRLGPDVEVLGPDALRSRITAMLGAALDAYRPGRKTAIRPRRGTS